MPVFDKKAHKERIEWFNNARFGMFIHWGLYAIPARGEWLKSALKVSEEEYQQYFDEFNPIDYNPRAWAEAAAKAGMKYAVLTAKHHDGFCLFDSALTDYKSTNTPAGRDLVKEYVEAFREAGLKVGLYYSTIDWHHPHFPTYSDPIHPRRGDEEYKNHKPDFDKYLQYMHGQIKELCENYGKIDILWFDYSYDKLEGEAWRATELMQIVRSLQPNVIIDNRLEGSGTSSLMSDNPNFYSGDFIAPEQLIPPVGIFSHSGERLPWEACITMNNHWGYACRDNFYKPAPMLIRKLVECVSKGGNLLLNVGPDAKGNIPHQSIKILEEIGLWMAKNSESIYNCGYAKIEKPDYGRVTKNGKNLYFHIMDNPVGLTHISGIKKEDIASIRRLADGSKVEMVDDWRTVHYSDTIFLHITDQPQLPDEIDTVIKVVLK